MEEISIETENEGVIHRYITEKETETNMYTFEEVIYECTYVISPDIMENYVNKNLNDNKKKYFIKVNDTGIDDEEGEYTTETES